MLERWLIKWNAGLASMSTGTWSSEPHVKKEKKRKKKVGIVVNACNLAAGDKLTSQPVYLESFGSVRDPVSRPRKVEKKGEKARCVFLMPTPALSRQEETCQQFEANLDYMLRLSQNGWFVFLHTCMHTRMHTYSISWQSNSIRGKELDTDTPPLQRANVMLFKYHKLFL